MSQQARLPLCLFLAVTPWTAQAQVLINEVLASTTGTDVEYIELIGPADQSLAGLSLVVVEGQNNSNQGQFTFRFDFAATDALGDNGFFLVGNARVASSYDVTPNATVDDNALQNGSETIGLVATTSLSGDGVAGGETVLDSIGLLGPAADVPGSIFYFDAPVVGPDGSFFPAGARRATDGVDTDAAADWVIADFDLGPANTPTAGETPPVPALSLSIPALQGSGTASPHAGRRVAIEGIVVGDFQGADQGADGSVNGFYVQDPAGDGDDSTSDGVFVFDGFAPSVDVARGDRVRVTGDVTEFFGETQISAVAVEVLEAPAMPDVAGLARPVALPAQGTIANADGRLVGDLEAYEGMLVRFPDQLTVGEYFNLDRFGEVRLSQGGRAFQFTQRNAPNVTGFAAHVVDLAARTVMLDDGLIVQNPDPIRYPAPGLDTGNAFRGGDAVVNLIGVVRYSRGSGGSGDETYRVLPIAEPVFVPLNTRPATPEPVGGRIALASFNVLNYFNTLDDGSEQCGPPDALQECRGADASFGTLELDRQTAKLVAALLALDADIVGLIEIENDYADGSASSVATLVAAVNDALGAEVYAFVDPGVPYLGGDAIAVGLIYKRAVVAPAPGTSPAVLHDGLLDALGLGDRAPVFDGEGTSRSPLAASFVDKATLGVFTVAVNHFKSKSQGDLADPTDPNFDRLDGQGFFNARRVDTALALTRWLATDPTGSRDPDVAILGDLNAYASEDPVVTVLGAGYFDPLDRNSHAADRYSYVFDGQLGTLDYALVSSTLYEQTDNATIWAINADEADGLDYNLDFGRPAGIFDGSVPYRSSDHDPVIVGLAPFAPGDFDGNERLDTRDLARVLRALHTARGEPRYDASVDLDLDARVDAHDLLAWLKRYLESLKPAKRR